MVQADNYHFVMSKDGKWIKKPGRLQFSLITKSIANSDKIAGTMVNNDKLERYHRDRITSHIAKFVEAYDQSNNYLCKPKGNIPVVEDSMELRNLWHSYLFKGRELIDEIGSVVHICFGLKQKTTGLNKKKFNSLRNIILQAMRHKEGLDELLNMINAYEDKLVEFIELRNKEKNGDTLLELPMISEVGVPSGGKISGIDLPFVEYVKESQVNITNFVKFIVGQSHNS